MGREHIAFDDGDTKSRIKNVLNYKKPAFGVVNAAIIVISVVCIITLISNPLNRETDLKVADYQVKEVVYDTTLSLTPETRPYYSITANHDLYTLSNESSGREKTDTWEYVGTMEAYPLTVKEVRSYTGYKAGWISNYNMRKITDAYILRLENAENHFYLAFQTRTGDTLLAYGWEDISERGQGPSDDTSLLWICKLESMLKNVQQIRIKDPDKSTFHS